MSEPLSALVVTSLGAPPSAVTPVLAALQVSGIQVRAIDVGRAGSREESTVGRFVRAIAGEFAERRLEREISANPPDVVVGFEPASVHALTHVRNGAASPAPVVAVVAELSPGPGWAGTEADRYLALDDECAVALSDKGIDGHRIMTIGPVAEYAFVAAANQDRGALRKRFKLAPDRPVVLVATEGLGYEGASQIALQLSLVANPATYLFDAGDDGDAAMALRSQVPALDLKAKLFGHTADAPLLWRSADVLVARPSAEVCARALVLGAPLVAFLPEDKRGEAFAAGMSKRKAGHTAANALLISSVLEPILRDMRSSPSKDDNRVAVDGAGNCADIISVVGSDRSAVIEDNRTASHSQTRSRVRDAAAHAESASRVSAAPGELEDLSGGIGGLDFGDVASVDELADLERQTKARISQVGATIASAQAAADKWGNRSLAAKKKGDADLAKKAERKADAERARMHAGLAEMAQLNQELEQLERAKIAAPPKTGTRPPIAERKTTARAPRESVDDMLNQMKRSAGNGGSSGKIPPRAKRSAKAAGSAVDSELDALKRKMAAKDKRRKK